MVEAMGAFRRLAYFLAGTELTSASDGCDVNAPPPHWQTDSSTSSASGAHYFPPMERRIELSVNVHCLGPGHRSSDTDSFASAVFFASDPTQSDFCHGPANEFVVLSAPKITECTPSIACSR
ncbi:hypothetical protein JAAARDRAFT_42054 [Jaapia argillacea MUCL 33604]|uniref:Uncharacterized protein n=1 Tax=Jaapia argillacea MUCL 33604 TaxID=933084 RepID=A0A067PIX3_9AGAM|nr:hypothetical protein JAAARDRAFT_42054 [Jaapia argillacea MUCL 33604]